MGKTSKSQLKASAKWNANHRQSQQYSVAKSTAKRFVTKMASQKDLSALADLIKEKQNL